MLKCRSIGRSALMWYCSRLGGRIAPTRSQPAALNCRPVSVWSPVTGVCRRRLEWLHVTYALCETTRDGTSVSSLFQHLAHNGYNTLWNFSFGLWFKKCKVSDSDGLIGLKLRAVGKWLQWWVHGALRFHLNLRLRARPVVSARGWPRSHSAATAIKCITCWHIVWRWSLEGTRYSTFADLLSALCNRPTACGNFTYDTDYNDLIMRERFLLSNLIWRTFQGHLRSRKFLIHKQGDRCKIHTYAYCIQHVVDVTIFVTTNISNLGL